MFTQTEKGGEKTMERNWCIHVCIRGAHEWQLTFTSPVSGKLGTRLYDYRPRARELGLVLCECGKSSMALGNRSDGRREGEEKFVSWKQRRRVWKFAIPFPDRRFEGCKKLVRRDILVSPRKACDSWFDDSNKNDTNKSWGGKLAEAVSKVGKMPRWPIVVPPYLSRFNDPWNEPRWRYCDKSPRI